MAYELFCKSIQGAGHINKGMPCEDYGTKYENEDCKIFVLGDGHGDSNCPRSSFGSKAICEIAVEELCGFASEIKNQDWVSKLFCEKTANRLVLQLVSSIFGKWSYMVKEDYQNNPFTEKEKNDAKECMTYYVRGEKIEHIYGTTFLAGVLTSEYALLLQQGDGRCVVFDENGDVSQPVPWDERCMANISTSVCDTDAVVSCRYHVVDLSKNRIIACILSTDGVEDSFGSMDMMHTFYREEMTFAAENGVKKFEEHLCEVLPFVSHHGSRDDITVCGVIDVEATKNAISKFNVENERIKIEDAVSKAQEQITAMTPKMEYLKDRCDEANKAHKALKMKLADLDNEYKVVKADLNAYMSSKSNVGGAFKVIALSAPSIKCLQSHLVSLEEKMETVSEELQSAFAKKRACDDEYNTYKQKCNDLIRQKKENEEKIIALNSAIMAVEPEEKDADYTCQEPETEVEVEFEAVFDAEACVTQEQNECAAEESEQAEDYCEDSSVDVECVPVAAEDHQEMSENAEDEDNGIVEPFEESEADPQLEPQEEFNIEEKVTAEICPNIASDKEETKQRNGLFAIFHKK